MAKADETYHDLLKAILLEGKTKDDRTETGTTSIFGKQIRFKMEEGFPLLTTKKIHTKSIIHELLWFLNGETNVKYLQDHGVTIWDEWADSEGELGPIYGKQWVNWKGINQIQRLINILHTDADSRRMMLSSWNVGDLDKMKLPPCHYGFQLYTRELSNQERITYYANSTAFHGSLMDLSPKKLDTLQVPQKEISLMWSQRSVDTFLGLPFNIASYALLLHMFAQQVSMLPGDLIGNLGDVHIYDNHKKYVTEQLTRSTNKRPPRLKLTKASNIFSYTYEDFEILNYEADPNWKDVPIAV
jgi:thymidylate synthase